MVLHYLISVIIVHKCPVITGLLYKMSRQVYHCKQAGTRKQRAHARKQRIIIFLALLF